MKSRNKSVVKFSLYLHSFSKFFFVYPKSYIQIFFPKFYFLKLSLGKLKNSFGNVETWLIFLALVKYSYLQIVNAAHPNDGCSHSMCVCRSSFCSKKVEMAALTLLFTSSAVSLWHRKLTQFSFICCDINESFSRPMVGHHRQHWEIKWFYFVPY